MEENGKEVKSGAARKALKQRARQLAETGGHTWTLMSGSDKKYFKRQARKELRAAAETPQATAPVE